MSYTHPHSDIMCSCSCEPCQVDSLRGWVFWFCIGPGMASRRAWRLRTKRRLRCSEITNPGGFTVGGLCVITWLTFEVPIASVATVGVVVRGVRAIAMPGPQMAWVRGRCDWWGTGVGFGGNRRARTRRSSHSVRERILGIVPFCN